MALRNRRLKFFIDIHLESGCMFRRFGNLSSSLTCCRTSLKLCNSFLQLCNFGLMFLFQLCNFALMVFLKLSYFGLIFKALVFWKLKRKTFLLLLKIHGTQFQKTPYDCLLYCRLLSQSPSEYAPTILDLKTWIGLRPWKNRVQNMGCKK